MKETNSIKYPPAFVMETIRLVGTTLSKLLWRIKFHGTENIPQGLQSGLLITPNHQTYLDPLWVCLPIKRRFRFMAWDKVFEWFLVGDFIRYLGAFPVNLERGSKNAFKQALLSLRAGATLIIFPEGEREFSDGQMLEFKNGAIKIAMHAGVPILPVTIRGGNNIWAQDMKFPQLGKVEIFYHPVMEIPPPPAGTSEREHIDRLTDQLEQVIKSKL